MHDLRTAFRNLVQARRFTVLAVGTLALGLALSITTMSVVNAYLLRGLPYPEADRLYRVDYGRPGELPPRGLDQVDWASLADVVEWSIAWDLDVFYLLGQSAPEPAPGAWVTTGYLHAFGLRSVAGRLLNESDYHGGAPAVALISHRLWRTRFGGDPNIIGQPLRTYVSDRPDEPESLTIVGVLAPELWHFNPYTEVIAPLRAASYPYLVRLRPGVSASIAGDRIATVVRAGVAGLPADWRPSMTSQLASYTEGVRPVLWAVAVSAALILLIGAANVAVLTLIRGGERAKELAVRHALGASHGRLARLLGFEGAIVGVSATLLGLLITHATLPAVGPSFERFFDRRVPGGLDAFRIDGTVVAGAVAGGLVVTAIATLGPLLSMRRHRLLTALTEVSRAATDARRSGRARAILIGVEVAASLTLLAGAALMSETALRMLRVDFGVQADEIMTASLGLRQRSYPEAADRAAYYDRLLSRLAGVGASQRAALGDWWPLQTTRPVRVQAGSASATMASASVFAVSPAYFDTLGIRLRAGRDFEARDRLGSERVVVVSESLARRLWPGASAVGQRLELPLDGDGPAVSHLVIGIVSDVRQSHADANTFDAYVSLVQRAGRFAFLYLRRPALATWEQELRQAVAEIDGEVALGTPRTLAVGIEQERARPRFLAFLLSTLATLASLLALVGVHGAIAYAVGQRRREIAVRMAVGASGSAVMRLFVRQGLLVLALGLAAGLIGAGALGRVLESQLFDVAPADPGILAGATVAFLTAGMLAIWWPATRAARVDPAAVLRGS